MTTVRIQDLGPLSFDGVSMEDVVPSPIQRELLACLLAAYPDGVSTDRLLDLLWPDRPPRSRLVWTHVSRLRARLARVGLRVEDTGGGYRLAGDVVSDAERFATIARWADRPLPDSRLEAARLEEALTLWRGDYLEGFDVGRLSPGRREELRELRLAAALSLARERLSVGTAHAALGGLEPLVAEHPYSEAAAELLVLCLYCSGNRAESLRRLHGFRTRLVEDTGLEPGPGLADLERRILADDPDLLHPVSISPAHELPTLPRWTTSFVGRDASMAELSALLAAGRLVTLVGPAGVGKTRLAVETISRTAATADAIFIDLSTAGPGAPIDEIVAGALGLAGQGGPDLRKVLLRHLDRVPRILILDNCEHVIEHASVLAAEISEACRRCRLVATSRERLRVPDETVQNVEPLSTSNNGRDVPPAVQLLADRAGWTPVDQSDRDSAVELCRRLDGLPLAIELAANRLASMPAADLLAQMDNRFALLSTGSRASPRRHQTLASAVGWSVDGLSPAQRNTLLRCSTFAGRFSLTDAAAVCADKDVSRADAATHLVDLVERSLVNFGSGEPPYRLLDTLRQYGRDRLESQGEAEAWAERHAVHFAAKAVDSAQHAFGPGEIANFQSVLAQSGDYRNALAYARDNCRWETLADLVWGLTRSTFFMRGGWVEPPNMVADLVWSVPEPTPPRWSTLVAAVASTFQNTGRDADAERAAALAVALDPTDTQAWTQWAFATLRTDPAAAAERASEALRLADWNIAAELLPSLNIAAQGHCMLGDFAESIGLAHQLIEQARRFRSITAESFAYLTLSLSLPRGTPEAALAARQAVDLTPMTQGAILEVRASTLHLTHTLHLDVEQAAAILDGNLGRRALDVHVTYEYIVLGGAVAYFAVTGRTELAQRIAHAIGAFHVPWYTLLPEVEDLRQTLMAQGRNLPDPAVDTRRLVDEARAALRSTG